MATTVRVSLLNAQFALDATGDATFEPYSILATNDNFRHLVLRLGSNNAAAPTVKSGGYGIRSIPKNYAANPKVIIVWTATLTSGNVVFDFDYRVVGSDDSESLDQATYQESVTVTDAAPGATDRRLETSITLTAGNFAVDKTLEFFFGRDGVDAADTMAGSALVQQLLLEYTT